MRVLGVFLVPLILLTAFAAIPWFPSDLELEAKNAWLWTPGQPTLTQIPFAQPLHGSTILPAKDGLIVAYGGRDEGLERFDGKRFVRAKELDGTIYTNAPALPKGFDGYDATMVGAETWFSIERISYPEKTPVARTMLYRNGKWQSGPTLPSLATFGGASALANDILAVSTKEHLYLARIDAAEFTESHPIPDRVDVFVGTKTQLLVLTDDRVMTVDPTTGGQSLGPVLPLGKGELVVANTAVLTATGDLLFTRHLRGPGYDRRFLIPNLLGWLLLPPELVLAYRVLKDRRRWVVIGGVVTVLVLGFISLMAYFAAVGLSRM